MTLSEQFTNPPIWFGDISVIGPGGPVDFNITLNCTKLTLDCNNYFLTGGCGGVAWPQHGTLFSCSCSPIQLVFTGIVVFPCVLCSGPFSSLKIVITA